MTLLVTGRGHAETRSGLCAALLASTMLVAGTIPAAGQAVSEPTGRFEVSAGVGLLGGAAFGGQPANERTASGATYRLFDSSTELASSAGFEARVGVVVTRRITLEARAALGQPELRTSVSGDVEGAPAITSVERLDQYIFDGGMTFRVDEWRIFGLVPFASAGAGYLRQLHEGQTLVDEGHLFYAGGGVTRGLFARGNGLVRGVGLRADIRMNVVSGGVSFDDDSRVQGAFSGSVFVAF